MESRFLPRFISFHLSSVKSGSQTPAFLCSTKKPTGERAFSALFWGNDALREVICSLHQQVFTKRQRRNRHFSQPQTGTKRLLWTQENPVWGYQHLPPETLSLTRKCRSLPGIMVKRHNGQSPGVYPAPEMGLTMICSISVVQRAL